MEPRRAVRSRAATHATWVERLDRFAQSGLSPAQFCGQEGVSLPSFYAWKRRLPADAPPPSARLLPVRLRPSEAAVELVLPSGCVLRLPPGCDPAFVRSLVEA